MTIGERIKKLRLENKYTLDEIAEKLGTSRQTIFKYENNIVTNIPSDKIEKLALIFNVSPAFIMGWENDKNNAKINIPAWFRRDLNDNERLKEWLELENENAKDNDYCFEEMKSQNSKQIQAIKAIRRASNKMDDSKIDQMMNLLKIAFPDEMDGNDFEN